MHEPLEVAEVRQTINPSYKIAYAMQAYSSTLRHEAPCFRATTIAIKSIAQQSHRSHQHPQKPPKPNRNPQNPTKPINSLIPRSEPSFSSNLRIFRLTNQRYILSNNRNPTINKTPQKPTETLISRSKL
jgi:hypothetical protein